ncbi:low molecular weight protein-tyrosine-phosphatase [Azoarcus sp. KH32C]|uniref:low molecular weight protein-tyrosine-phosphatase n=1 Tax=Azoarcus sp. KH32C TaxID=748247 RepID=UPI0002386913|nr:low molecular weight protein-tyrosine-phosphatase [Azoarcus sp. KH32C]BAL23230.1 phosphotyrosine protein phosphatase [Azoarcus sp. KH32C]
MPNEPFFKRILVVCVGNICRSPTAEHILRQALEGSGCTVESAGLAALVGKPIDPTALEILTGKEQSPAPHAARQVTPAMLAQADLILVMEKRHLQDIVGAVPQVRGKTFLLGKWLGDAEIPDPFRKDRDAFEHAYVLIDQSVTAWARKICPTVSA